MYCVAFYALQPAFVRYAPAVDEQSWVRASAEVHFGIDRKLRWSLARVIITGCPRCLPVVIVVDSKMAVAARLASVQPGGVRIFVIAALSARCAIACIAEVACARKATRCVCANCVRIAVVSASVALVNVLANDGRNRPRSIPARSVAYNRLV